MKSWYRAQMIVFGIVGGLNALDASFRPISEAVMDFWSRFALGKHCVDFKGEAYSLWYPQAPFWKKCSKREKTPQKPTNTRQIPATINAKVTKRGHHQNRSWNNLDGSFWRPPIKKSNGFLTGGRQKLPSKNRTLGPPLSSSRQNLPSKVHVKISPPRLKKKLPIRKPRSAVNIPRGLFVHTKQNVSPSRTPPHPQKNIKISTRRSRPLPLKLAKFPLKFPPTSCEFFFK